MTDPETDAPTFGNLVSETITEQALWVRLLWGAAGVLCMALGVVGWLVPVITGIPFYILGILCFAKASAWAAQQINAWDRRRSARVRRALRWRPAWIERFTRSH